MWSAKHDANKTNNTDWHDALPAVQAAKLADNAVQLFLFLPVVNCLTHNKASGMQKLCRGLSITALATEV